VSKTGPFERRKRRGCHVTGQPTFGRCALESPDGVHKEPRRRLRQSRPDPRGHTGPGASSGDRRKHARFGIVGRLWGSLEVTERLPIVNVSRGGVCVRSPRPLVEETTNAARLVLDEDVIDLHVRVRYANNPGDAAQGPYVVGLEFVGAPRSTVEEIERLARTDHGAHT